jgi:AcrR family transcriptional regulator
VLTDEISSRLKMGKGTLYRYFPSKEELYFATLVDGLQGMQDAIDAVLSEPAPLEKVIKRRYLQQDLL